MNRILSVEALEIIDSRLSEIGLSLSELETTSSEVAIFGSFGVDEDLSRKDVDIFVVSSEVESRITKTVDLLCVSPASLTAQRWLESEVAGHIAKYGTWLKGAPSWVTHATVSERTVSDKSHRIISHSKALAKTQQRLGYRYIVKHLAILRRHLQRFHHLSNREFVPPTIILNAEWCSLSDHLVYLRDVIETLSASDEEKDLVKALFDSLPITITEFT